jgi:hypothetical protein
LQISNTRNLNPERDFDTVFASWGQLRAGALVIGSIDAFLNSRSKPLAALALRHAVSMVSLPTFSTASVRSGSAEHVGGGASA